MSTDLVNDGEQAEVTILEIEPGVMVLLGDHVPEGFEVEPLVMDERGKLDLTNTLASAANLFNVAAQGAQTTANVHGLVRLAPETMKALEKASPLVKDGQNLGTLVRNGKFAHSIRWQPANLTQTTGLLSGLGPAFALLAVTAQLTAISNKMDENIALTRKVLKELRQEQWDILKGLHETVDSAVQEARAVGRVTSRIFGRVDKTEPELRQQRRTFARYMAEHLAALNASAKERRDYLRDNDQQILADVQGMTMAEESYYRYQVLRAGEIVGAPDKTPEDELTLENLLQTMVAERQESLDTIWRVLAQLNAHCHLALEAQGRRLNRGLFSSKKTVATDEDIRVMIRHIALLTGRVAADPLELAPHLTVFREEIPSQVLSTLKWILPAQQPLLALADVNAEGWFNNAYLGITDETFFVVAQSTLIADGIIEHEHQLDDIRYVRFRTRGKKGPVLDIITKDEDVRLTFDDWVSEEGATERARKLADVLMSRANIPDVERCENPILHAGTTRHELLAADSQELA